jgi:hypothetical protein
MLVPCRNCGKEVGENASKCVHCGTETPNREINIRSNMLYGVLTAFGIICIKYDDWFTKNPGKPEWLPLLGITLLVILLTSLLWLFFKHLIDMFK